MKLYTNLHTTIIKAVDVEIKTQTFYQHKRPISIKNKHIDKIVVSNKICLGTKSFK